MKQIQINLYNLVKMVTKTQKEKIERTIDEIQTEHKNILESLKVIDNKINALNKYYANILTQKTIKKNIKKTTKVKKK